MRDQVLRVPVMDEEGTINVAGFALPLSPLLSATTRDLVLRWSKWEQHMSRDIPGHPLDPKAIPAFRSFIDQHFFPRLIGRSNELYATRIEAETIAGVYTETFLPAEGVSSINRDRVLINLHGGAFTVGARRGGQLESIPMSALGKIKVVSVDYRMAPEYRFPAATEDVVAVYRELLKTHSPRNIGVFGCSAGALLASQAIARLKKDDLPLPAAVGMLFAGAAYWTLGDSARFGEARTGNAQNGMREHPYFDQSDPDDPLVSPLFSADVLAAFPPSLLISSVRDHVLSSVVRTHSRLVSLGVTAELHVWEALEHAFFYNPDLPESREAHEVTVRFFDRYLGRG